MSHVEESVRSVRTADGLDLCVREWRKPDPVMADVLLCHGHGEHSARHRDGATALAGAGFRVIGWDHRGHGLSAGQRGHVDSFDQLLDDLDRVRVAAGAGHGRPLAAYGHSMGGLVLIHHALRHPGSCRAMATTCPWFRLRLRPPAWKGWLADLAADRMPRLALSTGLRPSQMADSPQLRLPDHESRLIHRRMSAAMFRALRRAAASALEMAAAFRTPLLILQGRDDPIMDPAGARAFRDATRSGPGGPVVLTELPGRKHEPHNDTGRETLQAEMINWFQRDHLRPMPSPR